MQQKKALNAVIAIGEEQEFILSFAPFLAKFFNSQQFLHFFSHSISDMKNSKNSIKSQSQKNEFGGANAF